MLRVTSLTHARKRVVSINPWLALERGVDPAERVRVLRRAHDAFLRSGADPTDRPALRPLDGPGGARPTGVGADPGGGPATAVREVREVVVESWRRSAGARVDPDSRAPIALSDGDLAAYRREHPLAHTLPLLRDLLGGVTDDGAHLMAVCDAAGRLLWVDGHRELRRRAARMNFVAGARWDEAHAGTNAPGTALAIDHAVQIFAAEHFNRPVQRWTCAAAPIHDPGTGGLLGAIDLTGGDELANPHSLALVRAAARAVEAELTRAGRSARPAPLWIPDPAGPPVASGPGQLLVLGRGEALLTAVASRAGEAVGGAGPATGPIRLGLRHSEILVLLVGHPEGITGEQLAAQLYGESANPITLRAEMSRLRRVLGPRLIRSRPYRLGAPISADHVTVSRLLRGGELAQALRRYVGPLLPTSEAPGIVELRSVLDARIRSAVLASPDPAVLAAWVECHAGHDDLQAWERLLGLLAPDDPYHRTTTARVSTLRRDYGLAGRAPSRRDRPAGGGLA